MARCISRLSKLWEYASLIEGSAQTEFWSSLRPEVHRRSAIVSVCSLFVVSLTFIAELNAETVDGKLKVKAGGDSKNCEGYWGPCYVSSFSWSLSDSRVVNFGSLVIVICVLVAFSLLVLLGCHKRVRPVVDWEKFFGAAMLVLFIFIPTAASDQYATNVFRTFVPTRGHGPLWCHWHVPNDQSLTVPALRIALTLDALLTTICFFVPLRLSLFLLLYICSLASFVSVHFLHPFAKSNIVPVLIYGILGAFACKGARDQNHHRWLAWRYGSELNTVSKIGAAMEGVATSFCDLVIPLSADLKLDCDGNDNIRSWLGEGCGCSNMFSDFLSISDASRWNEMLTNVRRSGLPGCISVTLHPRNNRGPFDINLLAVPVADGSYLLGVSQTSEQELPRTALSLHPEPTRLGHGDDTNARTVSGQQQSEPTVETSRRGSSTTDSVIGTEEVFREIDIQKILEIGISEHWLLVPGVFDIHFDEVLGSGGFGCVYGGMLCGSPIAVKCWQKNASNDPDKLLRYSSSASNELRVHRRVRHPNIALFHGACFVENSIRLVFEKVQGQTLDVFAGYRSLRNIAAQRCILKGISSAVWYLHASKPSIIHGDLKPSNIMIEVRVPLGNADPFPFAKLIDFGLSRILSPYARPLGGSRFFMAPEVHAKGRPSTSSDVYSFGCVASFVGSGRMPSTDKEWEGFLPASSEWRGICKRCLATDAVDRPNITEVFSDFALVDRHVLCAGSVCDVHVELGGEE